MAMFARRNPQERPPRTPEAPPSLNTGDTLGGVNWNSYRPYGPERNPRTPAEPEGEGSSRRKWQEHWDAEEKSLREKHYGGFTPLESVARGKINNAINNVLADPKFEEIQRGRKLLNDTYGTRYGGVHYQPLELMRSDRLFYNKGKAEEEQAGLDKLSKITSRRSLPEGYSVHAGKNRYGDYTAKLLNGTQQVGYVNWRGNTGYVLNLSIPEEKHRPMLAHLMDAAHKVSHEHGDTGPTHSESLTAYSYKLMKKYAPSSIADDATVENEDTHMYEGAVYAHQDEAQEARAQWNIAKPHLLNASTNNPLAKVRVTEHEKMMRQLESLTKQGRLLEAQSHAQDVEHSNAHLLYRAFPETHPRQVALALAKSGEHIRNIVNFYDALYS